MKREIRNVVMLLLTLSVLVLPTAALATTEVRLRLSTENLNLTVGQEATIALLVENAPLIYGVESHLTFDPAVLEVTALNHGNFLSSDPAIQAFILQNQADNEAGTIDYALVLLNPAPPVEGNGLLASITFRAKAAGPTTVEIKEAMFGTRTGEEIIPVVESAVLNISAVQPSQAAAEMTSAEEGPALELSTTANENGHTATVLEEVVPEATRSHPYRSYSKSNAGYGLWLGLSILGLGMIIGLIALVGIVGLMGGWFLIARTRRRRRLRIWPGRSISKPRT